MRHGLKRGAGLLAATIAALGPMQSAGAQGGMPAGCTGPASGVWINLTAEQVRNSGGYITLTLYPDDQSRFLKPNGSLYVTKVKAQAGTTEACIFVPGPGAYGLVLYHDENGNGRIDRNLIGIPKEGFGFSNNPKIFLSAPSFKAVRMTIGGNGISTRIRMKYP